MGIRNVRPALRQSAVVPVGCHVVVDFFLCSSHLLSERQSSRDVPANVVIARCFYASSSYVKLLTDCIGF